MPDYAFIIIMVKAAIPIGAPFLFYVVFHQFYRLFFVRATNKCTLPGFPDICNGSNERVPEYESRN
jgi:hypothetical protein